MSLNQREKSKMLGVWIPKEEYESLEEFLAKFSAGSSNSEKLRNFPV
jgi:hypothetical protein